MAGTIEDAFMEDIIADPDDDAPRLIYADWLDDHGQEARAEFIRVQIERARLGDDDERSDGLRRRERELLAEHGNGWLGDSREGCLHGAILELDYAFWRGFLDKVLLSPNTLVDHAPALYRLGPLSFITFESDKKGFERLGKSEYAGRLHGIELVISKTWSEVAPLLLSEHLTSLQNLWLGVPLDSNALTRFLAAPVVKSLRDLAVELTATGVEQVANCAALSQLRSLLLAGEIGPLGAQFLAGARHLGKLEELWLTSCHITPPGVRALAGTTRLSALSELNLGGNPLGNEGVDAIAKSTTFPRLTRLGLGHIDLGRSGLSGLASSPILMNLRALDLSGNQLGNAAMAILARGKVPPALMVLDVGDNAIEDEGAKALASWLGLAGLRTLRLHGNRLSAFGLKATLSSSPMSLQVTSRCRNRASPGQRARTWAPRSRKRLFSRYNSVTGPR